ncbi:MAG: Holliday junction branch migration DNA helicase RuvB [Patescibacteria group bacterium]
MPETKLVTPEAKAEDHTLDVTLRPRTLDEYVGQSRLKQNLKVFIQAATGRGEPLEHVLLHGAPGLGKTTLAHIIAREMGANIRITSGPAIERAGDLAAILTNLAPGDVLFIDEIHRLNHIIEEVLYPAMEDFALDVVIGKGPAARTLRLDLPKFTIIGATTRLSLLSSPLRDRFGAVYKLNFYEPSDMEQIVIRSGKILSVDMQPEAAKLIAERSRSTPRVANRLLKRVRDYAQVHSNGKIDLTLAEQAMSMLEVDQVGLDHVDRRILLTIIEKCHGGPVGVQTIAATTGEEIDTLEEVVEPFLLQIGFLARTNRGRVVTDAAYAHLGLTPPVDGQRTLL